MDEITESTNNIYNTKYTPNIIIPKKKKCGAHRILQFIELVKQLIFITNTTLILWVPKTNIWEYNQWAAQTSIILVSFFNLVYYRIQYYNMSEEKQTVLQTVNIASLVFKFVNTYSLIPKLSYIAYYQDQSLGTVILASIGIHLLLLDFYIQLKQAMSGVTNYVNDTHNIELTSIDTAIRPFKHKVYQVCLQLFMIVTISLTLWNTFPQYIIHSDLFVWQFQIQIILVSLYNYIYFCMQFQKKSICIHTLLEIINMCSFVWKLMNIYIFAPNLYYLVILNSTLETKNPDYLLIAVYMIAISILFADLSLQLKIFVIGVTSYTVSFKAFLVRRNKKTPNQNDYNRLQIHLRLQQIKQQRAQIVQV